MSSKPAAFLSYARDDDSQDGAFVTKLRERLLAELAAHGFDNFLIFQDRHDIKWGEEWERRIGQALAEVTFLIPIVTPRFFRSDACRNEVKIFVERESRRGRHDLILPVYYITTSVMDEQDLQEQDPTARVIAAHNYEDWRKLRNTSFTTKRVKDKVTSLAELIAERIDGGQVDVVAPPAERVRVLNPPPDLVPAIFRDRADVLRDLLGLLDRPKTRAVVLEGRDGMGKTAIAAEVLPRLREREEPGIDVFDYLSARGYRPVNAAAVIQDLALAHPDEEMRRGLGERLQSADLSWVEKLDLVLNELVDTRVLIVIDNAEDLLDETSGAIRDGALRDLIQDLCRRDDHAVQLLLVTSRSPDPLFRGRGVDDSLVLREGLPVTEMAAFLTSLAGGDAVSSAFMRTQSDRLYELTAGRPRTLELVYATLTRGHEGTLVDVLDAMRGVAPEDAAEILLDRLEGHLSHAEMLVLRAISIFGRPVPASAISHLLEPYLPSSTAAVPSVVAELAQRRLVRSDADLYYLPPAEADHVRGQIRPGVAADRDRTPPSLTRIALLHRAADYFAAEAERTYVSRVEHLGLHFSEIDLRVRGGEYDKALEAMDALDNDYLERWGHSDALTQWRRAIDTKLTNPYDRIRNLEQMAAAKGQQDEFNEQIRLLQRAIRLNATSGESDAEYDLDLRVNLAGARWDNWHITKARAEYSACLNMAHESDSLVDEAISHLGLGLCLVETGDFREAARHYQDGLAITERAAPADGMRVTQAELLLGRGMVELYQGSAVEAIGSFTRSRALAEELDDVLLAAQAMDAEALARFHLDPDGDALALAMRAVNIGMRSGVAQVSHAAIQTLVRIHLQKNDIPAAYTAVNAGARIRSDRRSIDILALRGIVGLRLDQTDFARSQFVDAHLKSKELLHREKNAYQILETNGLVLAGLVLCGEREHLKGAEKAYRDARDITQERGTIWLCMQLLNALTKGPAPKFLEGVRNAAMGLPHPTPSDPPAPRQ